MYLILYQPEDNCSRISTVVFFGIVFITKDEVEALFLKLRLAVVTPFSEEAEGVDVPVFILEFEPELVFKLMPKVFKQV